MSRLYDEDCVVDSLKQEQTTHEKSPLISGSAGSTRVNSVGAFAVAG
jgi:hypothetical protein